jgi:hypothetical protein
MLQLQATPKFDPPPDFVVPPIAPRADTMPPIEPLICPHCHQGRLTFIRTLSPRQAMAP